MKIDYAKISYHFLSGIELGFFDILFILALILSFFSRAYIFNFASLVQYPYQFPDSWSWLADGLHWAGYNTQISYRPPVFPLFISLFYRAGYEDALVISMQIFALLAAIGVYLLASKLYNKEVAFYSGILFLINGALMGWSPFILAEFLALDFMIFSFYFFWLWTLSGANNSKYLYLFGLLSALCFLTQYVGIIILPVVFTYLILRERALVTAKMDQLFLTLIIFFLVSSTWFAYRLIEFGNPFFSTVSHIQLMQLRPDWLMSILFYSTNTLLFAPISFLLICLAIYNKSGHNKTISSELMFNMIWIIFLSAFFIFIYYWNDIRFIIYWIVPILILSAVEIAHLRNALHGIFDKKIIAYSIFIMIILLSNLVVTNYQDKDFMMSTIATPFWWPPEWLLQPEQSSLKILQSNLGFELHSSYLLLLQNKEKYRNEKYKFNVGGLSNLDPLILPELGEYISLNSANNDIVAIKPGNIDWYIFWNQMAVLTKRQTISIDSPNNKNAKFIIVRKSNQEPISEFESYSCIKNLNNIYLLYLRINDSEISATNH